MAKLLSRSRKSNDPSTDEKKLLDWANSLVEDGRASRRATEAQWWENIATYCGDFWVDFDVHTNKLVEPSKPDHRVRLPVNLVQPAVRTEYAKLLKNRPLVDCLARSNDQADLHAAEVGDKLLYNYVEKQLHMPRYRRRMLQWVVICGTGGIFVDYDPRAVGEQDVLVDPQGNPIFDQRMIAAIQKYYREKKRAPKTIKVRQGELRHVALSPFQLLWDQSKLEYEDAWYCIISEVFDVDEVYVRWGKEIEGDKNATPGIIERRSLQQWDLTNKLEWQRGDTQRLAEVHRLFVRPGHRYFPDGGEVVFTSNELIEKTNFPFKHGMLPIGITGHVPAPWSRHSFSVIPQVKPLALEVSKTVSQMIENRNLIGNPPWMEYKQNRISGEIQNKPGMRLTIDWHPNVPEPHPIQMPEIPQYVQALVPIMKETIQEVTGQSEVSQGKVPAGARAGVTIAYLQEEDDTKLGPTVQEYEECIERVSWLDLQVIAEKYDAPRTIRIYRKHSDPEVFDFIGTMLEGVAGVVCQAGSALPRSKAAKQQFILDLWDRKIEQDPRRVRQWLELNEGDPDEFEEDINEAERENRKLMQGTPVEVKEWQNHAAHHYKHRQLMKSAQWDELQPPMQQAIEAHDEEHSNFERQAASQQMVQQMMAGGGAGGGGGAPAPPPTGGSNGNNAAPAPQFSGNGNGFAPPEDGQTGSPASFSPQ
jgi:hypothetical protein